MGHFGDLEVLIGVLEGKRVAHHLELLRGGKGGGKLLHSACFVEMYDVIKLLGEFLDPRMLIK